MAQKTFCDRCGNEASPNWRLMISASGGPLRSFQDYEMCPTCGGEAIAVLLAAGFLIQPFSEYISVLG